MIIVSLNPKSQMQSQLVCKLAKWEHGRFLLASVAFESANQSNMFPLQIPKPRPSEVNWAIAVGQGGEVCKGLQWMGQ